MTKDEWIAALLYDVTPVSAKPAASEEIRTQEESVNVVLRNVEAELGPQVTQAVIERTRAEGGRVFHVKAIDHKPSFLKNDPGEVEVKVSAPSVGCYFKSAAEAFFFRYCPKAIPLKGEVLHVEVRERDTDETHSYAIFQARSDALREYIAKISLVVGEVETDDSTLAAVERVVRERNKAQQELAELKKLVRGDK